MRLGESAGRGRKGVVGRQKLSLRKREPASEAGFFGTLTEFAGDGERSSPAVAGDK